MSAFRMRALGLVAIPMMALSVTRGENSEKLPVYMGRTIAHTMHWMGADWLTRNERAREESTTENFPKRVGNTNSIPALHKRYSPGRSLIEISFR